MIDNKPNLIKNETAYQYNNTPLGITMTTNIKYRFWVQKDHYITIFIWKGNEN